MSQSYSVYRIRFADQAEYFGVTCQLAARIQHHTTNSTNKGVAERMDTGMDFEISLMAKGIGKEEAQKLERGYIRSGKNVLNVHGFTDPKPRRKSGKSSQISISLRPSEHVILREMAAAEDVSIAHIIRRLIRQLIATEEAQK